MKTGGLKIVGLISSRLKFQSPANNLSMENEEYLKKISLLKFYSEGKNIVTRRQPFLPIMYLVFDGMEN